MNRRKLNAPLFTFVLLIEIGLISGCGLQTVPSYTRPITLEAKTTPTEKANPQGSVLIEEGQIILKRGRWAPDHKAEAIINYPIIVDGLEYANVR